MKKTNRPLLPSLQKLLTCLLVFTSIIVSAQDFTDFGESEIVFEGMVSSQEGRWSADRKMVYTINWFRPTKFMKGWLTQDSIPVLTRGGQVGNGLMVVSHSSRFIPGYNYVVGMETCGECLNGVVSYRPHRLMGEFAGNLYSKTKAQMGRYSSVLLNDTLPCLYGDNESSSILEIRFGNIYVNATGDSAHIDVEMKTHIEPKALESLDFELSYADNVFGNYAAANQVFTPKLLDGNAESSYNLAIQDLTLDKALVSLASNGAGNATIVIGTSFSPVCRFTFALADIDFQEISNGNTTLASIESAVGTFLCGRETLTFRLIEFIKRKLGVVFSEHASGITYTIDGVTYQSQIGNYSFTVFASSSDNTELQRAEMIISFDDNVFTPNQNAGVHLQVFSDPGTVLQLHDSYTVDKSDVDANTIKVVIESSDFGDLAELTSIPRPLCRIKLNLPQANCGLSPQLHFEEDDMQGQSFHFSNVFPNIMAYDPVIANDQENAIVCNDCSGFTPVIDELVLDNTPAAAGDNQILTIKGSNFGVYERGNPVDGSAGTFCTVLFTNGDDFVIGDNPQYIAAGHRDFYWDGIIHWTNTEIKVKIPSTDHLQGLHGPAASGKIKVRNRCNKDKTSSNDQKLDIAYSLLAHRQQTDQYTHSLGLRDGYEFSIANASWNETTARNRFSEALNIWCPETHIDFTVNEGFVNAVADPLDNINVVSLENVGVENGQAALMVMQAYYEIECTNDPNLDEGGYIMTNLDVIIDPDFYNNSSPTNIRNKLVHELGHAHMLNHARTLSGADPMMHPQAANSLHSRDIDGANRVFGTSERVSGYDCEQNGTTVNVSPVLPNMDCGIINSTYDMYEASGIKIYPVPTRATITVSAETMVNSLTVHNMTGNVVSRYEVGSRQFEIDLGHLPKGPYWLTVQTDKGNTHHKIVIL